MSPSTSHISGQLRQLVYYHLDNNMTRNALFLAGRLHAYEPRTSEASYLLALCHLLNGQIKAAYDYSKNFGSRGTHLGCSYVYAQACLDLGKYLDGIAALERSKSLWTSKNHWSKLFLSFLYYNDCTTNDTMCMCLRLMISHRIHRQT
jgi:anaphase-promoting complex subunit 3